MHQGLSPRVQHREEADRGTEMARIRGDGAEGVRGCTEEDAVDDRFVLGRDLSDRLRHGEDDVKVLRVEQVRGAVVDPGGPGQRLARGAMPITAAVVPDARVSAAVALFDMAAEGGGAALRDRGDDAPVRHRERRTHVITIRVAVAAEHVRDRRRRAIHRLGAQRAVGVGGWDGGATGRGSKSRGLAVAHTCVVAIARYRAVVARLR